MKKQQNIVRLENKNCYSNGWQVRFQRIVKNKKYDISKYFADGNYTNKFTALKAAISWRNKQLISNKILNQNVS